MDHVVSVAPISKAARDTVVEQRRVERAIRLTRGRDLVVTPRTGRLMADTSIVLIPPRVLPTPVVASNISLGATSYSGAENTTIQFAVNRVAGFEQAVTVNWAITGALISPTSGTTTFQVGQGLRRVFVNSGEVAANEAGTLTLSAPANLDGGPTPLLVSPNSASFTVTDTVIIGDIDIGLTASAYSGNENTNISFGVSRVGLESTNIVSVDWTITGATVAPSFGTATFNIGETLKIVTVASTALGATEVGTLTLSNPLNLSGGNTPVLVAPLTASFTVYDLDITIDIIPNITLAVDQWIDMDQYINNPQGLEFTTSMTGLNPAYATYDDGTRRLTGQLEGSLTGVRLVVDTVAQQWLGDGLSGEFGAIAVNDSWASTVYEYQRQYAPTLPTLPTPTGDVSGESTNKVNPNASDEYLAFTWDSNVEAACDNATYRVVFMMKGIAATGLLDNISINNGGTSDIPRWIIYCDPDNYSAIENIRPWDLALTDQARVERMNPDNCSYLYFVGLSYETRGLGSLKGNDDHITWYRCYVKDMYQNGTSGAYTGSLCTNITWFECFCDGSFRGGDNPDDVNFVTTTSPDHDNLRMISCEARDLAGDMMIYGYYSPNMTNIIVEDCDLYRTLFTDGNGATTGEHEDPSLDYARGEDFFDIKNGGAGPSDGPIEIGNRIWSLRQTDRTLHISGGSGCPFQMSNTDVFKTYVTARYNVAHDIVDNGVGWSSGGHISGSGGHSFAYNLVADIRGGDRDQFVIYLDQDNTEFYCNTFADTSETRFLMSFYRSDVNNRDVSNLDFKANCFIDTPPTPAGWSSSVIWTQNLASGCEIGHMAYIGSGEIGFEHGMSGTNYENTNTASMNFGDFRYRRRKLTVESNPTVANGGIGVIPNVVPTSNTPIEFRTGVQIDVGARTGIGPDDDIFYEGGP